MYYLVNICLFCYLILIVPANAEPVVRTVTLPFVWFIAYPIPIRFPFSSRTITSYAVFNGRWCTEMGIINSLGDVFVQAPDVKSA